MERGLADPAIRWRVAAIRSTISGRASNRVRSAGERIAPSADAYDLSFRAIDPAWSESDCQSAMAKPIILDRHFAVTGDLSLVSSVSG